MIEYIALMSVSLVVGYWLGTPTTVEVERHDHRHVENARRVTIAGANGGGATGGSVNVENIEAEEVYQR